MKHEWADEELIEHWTISEAEAKLLENKTQIGRLGFAVLLKFFNLTARLPRQAADVPLLAVSFIAKQLKSSPGLWNHYEWGGRNYVYHRQEIRAFFGFRKTKVSDVAAAVEYLRQDILPQITGFERQLFDLGEFFRRTKIELPTPNRQERILRSARMQFEKQLASETTNQLELESRAKLLKLLEIPDDAETKATTRQNQPLFSVLKTDVRTPNLKQVFAEIEKLELLRSLELPIDLFASVSNKVVENLRRRLAVEDVHEIRRHPLELKLTLLAAFARSRQFEVTDNLVDLLLYLIHKIQIRAEKRVEQEIMREIKRVSGKQELLFRLAETAVANPDGVVREVLFPVVNEQTLQDLVKEYKAQGNYQRQVSTVMRASYSFHYRRMTPYLLQSLKFRSNNEKHRPVIEALELISSYAGKSSRFFRLDEDVPLDGVVKKIWLEQILELDERGRTRIDRQKYEISVLQALRDGLRCKEIWVEQARRFRNPDEDLPTDFAHRRENYYQALSQPLSATEFIRGVKGQLESALSQFNDALPKNDKVQLLLKNTHSHIALSPLEANIEPINLKRLKKVIAARWRMTNLLDVLKETDLRTNFTESFKSATGRETLSGEKLQRRLLLCLYGLGTNTGLKRMSSGAAEGENYADLLYLRQRFITKDALRTAIQQVVNATLRMRRESLWGEGTTACASDSKKFASYDQNLRTEWHLRYGGRGVMIYWHVERRATCIYSQLKTCSSSEAAAMIEGLLRHQTEMEVEKNYVDSHGQSEVAFAFCHLLNFQLMPRLKAIHKQKLYRPGTGKSDDYPHLQTALSRPINWELIERQYDQMVKYATALRLGTADTESILRRFTRHNLQHPTYKALAELGKAAKTIFLCGYLGSEGVRREIHEGLNIVELWNAVNDFIFFGKGGEIASNNLEEQEITMLSLHLLQISLAYVNTLMIQQVLSEAEWQNQLTEADLRALTPLIFGHINPYGTFNLDLNERIQLEP